MDENRTEATKLVSRMWPKDQPLTDEQHESVVDIVQCVIDEYKHKTSAKVHAIETVWKHNYEVTKKRLQELENGIGDKAEGDKEQIRRSYQGRESVLSR